MEWVFEGSTYKAYRNGKLLGYIQKEREISLYTWRCNAFATRKESKSSGTHYTWDQAKQGFEDFWYMSLRYYGLTERNENDRGN